MPCRPADVGRTMGGPAPVPPRAWIQHGVWRPAKHHPQNPPLGAAPAGMIYPGAPPVAPPGAASDTGGARPTAAARPFSGCAAGALALGPSPANGTIPPHPPHSGRPRPGSSRPGPWSGPPLWHVRSPRRRSPGTLAPYACTDPADCPRSQGRVPRPAAHPCGIRRTVEPASSGSPARRVPRGGAARDRGFRSSPAPMPPRPRGSMGPPAKSGGGRAMGPCGRAPPRENGRPQAAFRDMREGVAGQAPYHPASPPRGEIGMGPGRRYAARVTRAYGIRRYPSETVGWRPRGPPDPAHPRGPLGIWHVADIWGRGGA